jgi:membrane dipeptidase
MLNPVCPFATLLVLASALVLALPFAAAAAGDAALTHANELLSRHILIDGHNDLPWAVRISKTAPNDVVAYDLRAQTAGQTDLARLRAGHLGGQFWSVYVPGELKTGWADVQLEQIDLARRIIERYPDSLALALTADDAERIFHQGKIASFLGIEGGHVIENSLGALRAYYTLGVRYMTLTHNTTLDWADSAAEPPARHGGLTRFGEEVVHEMNRLGMLVDLSHVAPETMRAALRVAEAPVIFSHSSTRALCDVARNVPDDVLALLPKNGGVVMIAFVTAFVSQEAADVVIPAMQQFNTRAKGLSEKERDALYKEVFAGLKIPKVTVAQVADHVEHARKVAGVDHIGLGADFDGNDNWPVGLEDVSSYPNLFAELIRRGWSDEDLIKLAGGNVLRALRQAEQVAKRLQASRPASTATLSALDGEPVKEQPKK